MLSAVLLSIGRGKEGKAVHCYGIAIYLNNKAVPPLLSIYYQLMSEGIVVLFRKGGGRRINSFTYISDPANSPLFT